MAMVCTTITEWIETEISKPIEEWEQRQEKECKKRPWWDPRRWLCWLVTHLVLVIRWVVVTVVTAVITIVCHLLADVLAILLDLLKFIGHLLVALFTWDKCALQEALADLADAITRLYELIGNVVIRPIVDRVQTYRLRRYVKHLIAERFFTQPDVVPRLWSRFNVDTGVFGYRLVCTVHRMYVDSQTRTDRFGDVPNLFALHDQGLINLYQLADFDRDCAIFKQAGWYRPRHYAVTEPFIPIGGQLPPRLTRDQLTAYIEGKGLAGPHFRIYAATTGNVDTRCDTAEQWGRQLGLLLGFERKDIEVTDERYINYSPASQSDFLIKELGRRDKRVDPLGAFEDLCSPVAAVVFGFTDGSLRGLTDNLVGTTWCPAHNLDPDNDSGVSFIDDIPDEIRRYVLIHELGHYFGLCHVDSFERVMVSGKPGEGDLVTWTTFPNVFLHGGPRFIYTEAQRVWQFIVTNFPLSCLDPDGGGVIL